MHSTGYSLKINICPFSEKFWGRCTAVDIKLANLGTLQLTVGRFLHGVSAQRGCS